jgi:ABC-2 type transport system permease protein
MSRLIAGECQKVFSIRLWLWLLLGSAALTALFVSLTIVTAEDPDTWVFPLTTAAGQRTLFSAGQGTGSLAAVLGAIGLTTEFRHKTATATLLATPRRGRVVVAKLVTYTLLGAGYGLVCVAVTIAIALPWLSAKGIDVSLIANGLPATFAGVVAALALFGLVGVGLGALMRDQVATVVVLLVYLFVAEPIVVRIEAFSDWTMYLPGPAAGALTQVSLTNQDFLAPWQGGLVLAAYGLMLALVGAHLTIRRDVT